MLELEVVVGCEVWRAPWRILSEDCGFMKGRWRDYRKEGKSRAERVPIINTQCEMKNELAVIFVQNFVDSGGVGDQILR